MSEVMITGKQTKVSRQRQFDSNQLLNDYESLVEKSVGMGVQSTQSEHIATQQMHGQAVSRLAEKLSKAGPVLPQIPLSGKSTKHSKYTTQRSKPPLIGQDLGLGVSGRNRGDLSHNTGRTAADHSLA